MKKTIEELQAVLETALKEKNESIEAEFGGDNRYSCMFLDMADFLRDTSFEGPENGLFEILEHNEGGEGSSEDCHVVVKFPSGEIVWFDYYYTSYDGCDFSRAFDSMRLVEPVERTVTFYE